MMATKRGSFGVFPGDSPSTFSIRGMVLRANTGFSGFFPGYSEISPIGCQGLDAGHRWVGRQFFTGQKDPQKPPNPRPGSPQIPTEFWQDHLRRRPGRRGHSNFNTQCRSLEWA